MKKKRLMSDQNSFSESDLDINEYEYLSGTLPPVQPPVQTVKTTMRSGSISSFMESTTPYLQ